MLSILTAVLKSNLTETKEVSSHLNCYYYNATSLRNKLTEFNSHFDSQEFDVISVSETWLNDSVFDDEIFTNGGYNIFRRDRTKVTVPDKDDGGGVLLGVKKSLSAKRRRDLETCMEILWVEITLSSKRSLFVGTGYMNYPNVNLVQKFEASMDKVAACMSMNHSVVIFGDYNMQDMRWGFVNGSSKATIINSDAVCAVSSQYSEVLDVHALDQYNTLPSQPHINENVLNLVLCNQATAAVEKTDKAASSTHDALQVYINLECVHNTINVSRTVYNFKRADFHAANQMLSYVDWSCLDTSDVNDALSYLYDIIFAVMKDCIPVQRINHKHYPYWYDRDIITVVKQKFKAHSEYVRQGRDKSLPAYQRFCELRKEVKILQKFKWKEYIENIGEQIKSNTKRFWSYVKSLKNLSSLPQVMYYNGRELKSYVDIASGFNLFFKSVFQKNSETIPPCKARDTALFRIMPISANEMSNELKMILRYTSTGSDNLPAVFLINCAEKLAHPLCKIFNLSISSGVYPDILKRNNVIPIYKRKGEKNDVEMYRGISIQPVLAKVFERLVNKRLQPHIKPLISENQHGFLPKKSCFSNLACYTDYISKHMDKKNDVHSIYTDFRKAFDTVPFNLLIHKLNRRFGIFHNELKWFESYLDNRYQRVVLHGIESAWVRVTSGVPQGSILGPLLFVMYIDDLSEICENSESLFFADDSKLFRFISCIADCLKLQFDLDKVYEWTTTWKIQLHLDKCYFICFSNRRKNRISFSYCFGSHVIESVDTVKDLGIYFTSNLNFRFHIECMVSKALRMLGFVYRTTKPFNDNSVMLTLYKSLVRSGLEYCSSIWSPSQQYLITKIERVQKRLLRWLCYRDHLEYNSLQYENLCEHYGLQTLQNRRKITDLCNLNKICNNNINSSYLVSQINIFVPNRRLRRNRLFSAESRLNIRKGTFITRSLALANKYEFIDIFEYDKSVFKRNIVSILH